MRVRRAIARSFLLRNIHTMPKGKTVQDAEKVLDKLSQRTVKLLTRADADAPGCFVCRARGPIQLAPARVQQFSYEEVAKIIREKMPIARDCTVTICDQAITTYPNDVFLMFMEYANARGHAEYQAEQFDCDDFSVGFCAIARKWHARLRADSSRADSSPAFAGSPVGMCHGKLSADSGAHAFNFWIAPTRDVVFIEPQTGEFITFGTGAMINFVYI